MEQAAELPIPSITEGQQKINDYGFREVKNTGKTVGIDRKVMPWLPVDGKILPLAEVTLQSSEQFFLGSAIEDKTLQKMAEELSKDDSEKANKLFYAEVQRYLENPRRTKTLDNQTSTNKIRYASNGQGSIRIYFMELGKDPNTDLPVILRIAACKGKGNEIDVLSVLTTENRKTLTKKCLGK